MDTKIPATVSILTHNSERTLARALKSVQDFADILVADGASSDATLEIARTYGARIIPQDARAMDGAGRIVDWSIVRNQCLREAKHPWHFYLDSDEFAGPKLVEEIRSIVATGNPEAYWVPRKYMLNGIVIERSISYPNQQMRFFHADAVTEFRKPVHERIIVREGAVVGRLANPMFVPAEDDYATMRAKTERYLERELARHQPLTWAVRIAMLQNAAKAIVRAAIRLTLMLFEAGPRMPLSRDLLAPRYEIDLALRSLIS